MSARSIFVGGTSSHAGKSWMATAICRHLRRKGLRVAPFKAQNMSNNSWPCRDGGEIGRAQVAQSEACSLEPVTDMNPVLLKPNSDTGCQVVVNGRVWRNVSAREYYEHFPFLLEQVLSAYERLSAAYDIIVVEGAGSLTEINLRARDLVNFGLATRIESPVLLVADIERGGVFASVAGTFCLLPEAEHRLIRSFAINKFRGDCSLFDDGAAMLERRTGRPCLGVFPADDQIRLDPEDALTLDDAAFRGESDVAVLRFPRISNFTDLRLLPNAMWIDKPVDVRFRAVILPGTKNTLADLRWLRGRGLESWVIEQHAAGAVIGGICGGYQMLGDQVSDPDEDAEPGLGLLPVTTVMQSIKTTRQVTATLGAHRFSAYEIHMGETACPAGFEPFAMTEYGPEGIRSGRVFGTYLHGALEDPQVVRAVLGVEPAPAASKEESYDQLANWFENHANLRLFEELYL